MATGARDQQKSHRGSRGDHRRWHLRHVYSYRLDQKKQLQELCYP